MHRDFIQMVMPKFRLYTSSGDIPAETSGQSWPLCTQTQASKMIREGVLLEETKPKRESSGSSSFSELPSSMETESLSRNSFLKKVGLLRAIQREIIQAWIIEGERTLFIGRP